MKKVQKYFNFNFSVLRVLSDLPHTVNAAYWTMTGLGLTFFSKTVVIVYVAGREKKLKAQRLIKRLNLRRENYEKTNRKND